MLDVSVIIVSFNTNNLTLKCIESVMNEGSELKIEIIVVDNDSTDGSVFAIRKYFDSYQKGNIRFKLIENSENLGFAKANNQGIKVAGGKYILLLNSDTNVSKDAIKRLVDFTKTRDDIGVVVPKLINKDGSIQGSVFKFPGIARAINQYWLGKSRIMDKYAPSGVLPCEIEAATMAVFLITPLAKNRVGLLDERYFMYFEDLDYCRKVMRAGLKVYYLPEIKVIHYHGESGKVLSDNENQWRRLIPPSKIYHGIIKHYLLYFILHSSQIWKKLKN